MVALHRSALCPTDMDTVFVRDLSVRGTHGVEEHERHTEQEFLIDIDAEFDSAPSAKSDQLKDTVDYMEFVAIATKIIESNSFFLIEKLAEYIAQDILLDPRIGRVTVTVKKPAVLESGVPGISITRTRS